MFGETVCRSDPWEQVGLPVAAQIIRSVERCRVRAGAGWLQARWQEAPRHPLIALRACKSRLLPSPPAVTPPSNKNAQNAASRTNTTRQNNK